MTTTARPALPCASSASIDPMDCALARYDAPGFSSFVPRDERNWLLRVSDPVTTTHVNWRDGKYVILAWRTATGPTQVLASVVPAIKLPCPSSAAIPMRAGIRFTDTVGGDGSLWEWVAADRVCCVKSGSYFPLGMSNSMGSLGRDRWARGDFKVLSIPPEPQATVGTPGELIDAEYDDAPSAPSGRLIAAKPIATAAQLCDRIPFNARCTVECFSAGRHVEAKAKAAWKAPRQDAVKREDFGTDGHTIHSAGAGHVGKFNKVARLELETPRHFFGVEKTDPMRRPRWPTARYERPGRRATVGVQVDAAENHEGKAT